MHESVVSQHVRSVARRPATRLVASLVLFVAIPAAGADADVTPVDILAIGQHVQGLGALGAFTGTLCLAADGRVGAGVSGADAQPALACGDASGFTAIARAGDPSPRGGVFVDFRDCALPADGAVYFAATRRVAAQGRLVEDVYRATPDGIEWIVGADAVAGDGTRLQFLGALDGVSGVGASVFEVNDRGTVLVRAQTVNGQVLVRVPVQGTPEALRVVSAAGQAWATAGGLAADDAVIALVRLPPSGEPAILRLEGAQTRLLFTMADIAASIGLVGAINPALDRIMVRGEFFILQFEYWLSPSLWQRRFLLYSPSRGFAPAVDEALYDDIWVVDLTAGGDRLVAGYRDEPWPNFSDNVVVDDAGVHLISRELGNAFAFPDALALNDRGNVVLQRRGVRGGSVGPTASLPVATPTPAIPADTDVRQSLLLVGAPPDADVRCFVPPTAIEPTSSPTQTGTPAPTPTPRLTATPAVDCAVQPDSCAQLRVGSASGTPGERVTVAVGLDPGPWSVVGLQGDLRLLHAAPVARTETGEPACRVNPALGKPASRFGLQPAGCSTDCTHVRAVVLSFDNVDPIPSGVSVFSCDLSITAAAVPGTYPLTLASPEASDARGDAIPVGSTAGALTVHRVNGDGASLNAAADAGGDGCQVGPSRRDPAWLSLGGLAALALGWRLARSRRVARA